ncbi:MAG: hypothetical protein E7556_08660 [Ruminococcaceae bacterium]|nr:hypothetical protein [Oscillospiraceae bacterium]
MKKIIAVFLSVLFTSSCMANTSEVETSNPADFYNPQITENIFFERLSDTKHGIYISADNSVELPKKEYIVQDVLIFRYAYDDGYLVYHWNNLVQLKEPTSNKRFLNGIEYEITDDLFTVFDISNNEYFDFRTQNRMIEFCTKNNIDINWKYSNGFLYETIAQIKENDVWSVSKATSESLMGFVLKNNEVVYEGYISDVYSNNKNILAFKLEIPSENILEFRDLKYNDISVSFNEVIKKRRELLFLTEDIYYSRYIIIDTKSEKITEYDNKWDYTRALKK